MKTVRNVALAFTAAGALALGGAAFAQDEKQPEQAAQPGTQKHEHRGEHRTMHRGQHGEKHGDKMQHGHGQMQPEKGER